jgi:hypothetical protein
VLAQHPAAVLAQHPAAVLAQHPAAVLAQHPAAVLAQHPAAVLAQHPRPGAAAVHVRLSGASMAAHRRAHARCVCRARLPVPVLEVGSGPAPCPCPRGGVEPPPPALGGSTREAQDSERGSAWCCAGRPAPAHDGPGSRTARVSESEPRRCIRPAHPAGSSGRLIRPAHPADSSGRLIRPAHPAGSSSWRTWRLISCRCCLGSGRDGSARNGSGERKETPRRGP